MMGLAWFLLTANWFIGIPLMIAIVIVVLSRLQKEENMLHERFEDEYDEYMEGTDRFLPQLFSAKRVSKVND
jgi:protein-S-isoprenylcysteine O-methyltransferase Ste14